MNSFTSDIVTAGTCKKEVFMTVPTENSVNSLFLTPSPYEKFKVK